MASMVVVGSEQAHLAKVIAMSLGAQYHPFKVEHFADTETRISGLAHHNIVNNVILIVFQFPRIGDHGNPLGFNDHLFYFLLLVQTIRAMNAKKIIVFMPYFPYSRQDKEHLEGVEPTVALVGQLFKSVGVDLLIASDIHSSAVQKLMPLPLQAFRLEAFWVHFLHQNVIKNYDYHEICIASPDRGAMHRIASVATDLDFRLIKMTKKRIAADQSMMLSIEGDVKNKVVIIIDDIIDTAMTAVNACNVLRKNGAAQVIGCFTHAILSRGACERLEESSFDKLYLTNTLFFDGAQLDDKFCVVSVDDFLANAVVALLRQASNG